MNLQMIDHFEKILSPSLDYDLQLLKKAGFSTYDGLPNLAIINLEVARFSTSLADRIRSCGLDLTMICHYFEDLLLAHSEHEIYLLLLFLIESLAFPLPFLYMQLPSAPFVLSAYLTELIEDFRNI